MKVGEYARLNNTVYNTVVILKIMEIFDNTILTENDGSIFQGEYGKDEVIKHSYNIIDLIEVGDVLIVKEYCDEVCQIFAEIYLIKSDEQLLNIKEDLEKNKNHKLYSIVTKEQFKNMGYRIKEEV